MRHQLVPHLVLAVRQVNVPMAKVVMGIHHAVTKIAFIAGKPGRTRHQIAQNHAKATTTANQKKFALVTLLVTSKIPTFPLNLSIAVKPSKKLP